MGGEGSSEGNKVSNKWSADELKMDGDGWSPMKMVFFSLLLWVGCFCYFVCECCCFLCVCMFCVFCCCFLGYNLLQILLSISMV